MKKILIFGEYLNNSLHVASCSNGTATKNQNCGLFQSKNGDWTNLELNQLVFEVTAIGPTGNWTN
jgi:hypothetical protein